MPIWTVATEKNRDCCRSTDNSPGCYRSKHAFSLCRMRGDDIHERRRQAIIRLQTQAFQVRADVIHLFGWRAGFDDRGHEGGKLWRLPTVIVGKLDVNEIEPVKRMIFVFDMAVHVDAT